MAVITGENTNVHDLKQINDTLYAIHEKLKYYFMNLDPEDNFSPEALLKYQANDKQIAILELTEDGVVSTYGNLEENISSQIQVLYDRINLKVDTGDVTNQLNLEPGALNITGNRLEIYGGNITLDANNNLTFRGEIEATTGNIAGWTINNNQIIGSNTSRITCSTLSMTDWIDLDKVVVNGNTDFSGAAIAIRESPVDTDKTTIFLNGFETMDIIAYRSEVVAGACRVYGDVDVSGQVTCRSCYTSADGRTWSDARLKEDVCEIKEEEAASFLQNLNPYAYNMKETGLRSCGFISQDVEAIQDHAGKDYGLIRTDKFKRLNYNGILTFLLKALQMQTKKIGELYAAGK